MEKQVGRVKGTKVEVVVPAQEFIDRYIPYQAQGLSYDEMATQFKLSKSTIVQKRLAINAKLKAAGNPLQLPSPKGAKKGAKKIDWSAIKLSIENAINE